MSLHYFLETLLPFCNYSYHVCLLLFSSFLNLKEKKLKELFQTIPTADDLQSLGMEGLKGELILVDIEKDKRLSMLKQLSLALVKGLSSNPASLIKKLASLVSLLFLCFGEMNIPISYVDT